MIWRGMRRLVQWVPVPVGAAVLLYVGGAVFQVRATQGTAYSTVQVDQFWARL